MVKSLMDIVQQQFTRPEQEAPTNRIELCAAVLMLEIGLADADFDEAEREAMKAVLTQHFLQSPAETEMLISTAEAEVDKAVSLYQFTRFLNDSLSQTDKLQLLEALWEVAFADAVLDKYEEYYLRKIADLLYISHSDYIKTKHKVAAAINNDTAARR